MINTFIRLKLKTYEKKAMWGGVKHSNDYATGERYLLLCVRKFMVLELLFFFHNYYENRTKK